MYVVTGGAGFIGSNLLAALETRGIGPLVVIDRCDDPYKRHNIRNRGELKLVEPEQTFPFLYHHASNVKAIFHLGALSSTIEHNIIRLNETNVYLSQKLWKWCAEQAKPFIYASSAATYGDGAKGFDDDSSVEALLRLTPLNPYGQSKHTFDIWVANEIARGSSAPPIWSGLKFFNVYGPNEFHKGAQSSLVPQIYRQAADGEPCMLFRSHNPNYMDGNQKRDFVFVDDCCDVMIWLIEQKGIGCLFNLGTGTARTFYELATSVYKASDREPNITYCDTPKYIRDQYQYFTEARMDRLRAAGYLKPFTSLEDGVAKTVQNYLSKEDPYR
ncbi:MAG: ADP-glyceromanno-heptose 6-epimerase [Candidatus Marinimicrobia bacterium]|nr:ADP-glyceromanno-heptose 6-epimerase [Candidatus Neomarinimicrobiota bacterium]